MSPVVILLIASAALHFLLRRISWRRRLVPNADRSGCTHAHIPAHTHKHTRKHAHKHTRARTHTHTKPHTRAHTKTQTHAHTKCLDGRSMRRVIELNDYYKT
jgi:hypothetical protein